jgi:hypothetical protein
MSITPSIFNRNIPYTVVGGDKFKQKPGKSGGLSFIVLNRGGRFNRERIFRNLAEFGSHEIISVEGPTGAYDVESLSKKFQSVRFLLIKEKISPGEQINLGIEEAENPFIFVLWNDMLVSSRLSGTIEPFLDHDNVCLVPAVKNVRSEYIPSIQSPALLRKHLKIVPLTPGKGEFHSLFPYDYCGIYNKDRFIHLEGFDPMIKNPYWQKLDFGFRAHMWGDKIRGRTDLIVTLQTAEHVDDSTRDYSYKLFFLKNLMPTIKKNGAVLKWMSFLPFFFFTGDNLFVSLRDFKQVKEWIKINSERFRLEARKITEQWEADSE